MIDSGYVNLDYIVAQVMSDRGIDDRGYERILQKAIDGYQQLNFNDVLTNLKTVEITVDSQNTAKFPNDYVNYVSIALTDGKRLIPLTLNRNMALPTNAECGEWVRDAVTETNEEFDDINYTFPRDYMQDTNYTIGGAFNHAYYRIDEENKQILFLKSSATGLTIILDYKAADLSGNTVVPRDAVLALVNYVHWHLNRFDKSVTLGDKEYSRQQWIIERNKLYIRRHSFTLDEWLDMRYKNTHRGLK